MQALINMVFVVTSFFFVTVANRAVAQDGQTDAAGAEEMDDPLAELANLGDAIVETGPEGGGSIRAKEDADVTRTNRLNDKRNLDAKVEAVNHGKFPAVAIRVKVRKPAKEGKGKEIKKGQILVVVPKMKVAGGKVDMGDPETLINAGAFYLKKGDKVKIRIGEPKGKLHEAEYIERK